MPDKILRIMLVEDDRDDAVIIKTSLIRAFDDHVILDHATNLSRALAMVDDLGSKLDLILLDVNLPDADGLTGLQALADAVNAVIPIIILTGSEDTELALKAIRTAAQDFLPKHALTGSALLRAIQFALARHEKEIQSNIRQATMEAEISTLRARKDKLEHQASELEKLASTLIRRTAR